MLEVLDPGVVLRWFCRLRNSGTSIRISLFLCLTMSAAQGSLANDTVKSESVKLLANDDCVIDNKITVRCDRLSNRLQSAHSGNDAWITLFIDNGKYETVVATLDSLARSGFTNVNVFPPFNGTNLSSAVKRWIRLSVWGVPNHISWMLLISTERFKTWHEQLLVLSPLRYEEIDRVTVSRMARPVCKSMKDSLPAPLSEYGIVISEHSDDLTRSCVIPTAESCEYLSALMNLPDMRWTEAEIQSMSAVRKELPCEKSVVPITKIVNSTDE
jgi:hypothetical protein